MAFIKKNILWLVLLVAAIVTIVAVFILKSRKNADIHFNTYAVKESSVLASIQNLEDYYKEEDAYDPIFLSGTKSYDKKMRSIKVYRFDSSEDTTLLHMELFFDFKGKLIKSAYYSGDYATPAFTYFFYDGAGKNFIKVSISQNKYDTIYRLRNYDQQNHITEEINYNISRKELNNLMIRKYKVHSDSLLQIEETLYDHDLTINDVLPYYIWDTYLTLNNTEEVHSKRVRTVCQDTVYNSIDEKVYKLVDQKMLPLKNDLQYEYNAQQDWVKVNAHGIVITRVFDFYDDNEPEEKRDFDYNKNVLLQLDSLMQTLPIHAWKNHTKRHNDISSKAKIYNEDKYGKEIELQEAKTIEAFTPVLWYLVDKDSGSIDGIKGKCFVAAYNTPIRDENQFNKRCLGIYERVGNIYKLRKQSLNALEVFNDSEEDFLYDGFDEANFSVSIEQGLLIVSYSYMRGEANYWYAYKNGNWILAAYESHHRTCCQAEATSYDYTTQTYKSSVSSFSGDEPGDTSITIHQERPVIYMDSMNVMQYDYDETGLLVK